MGKGLALIPQDPMTSLNPGHSIGRQITDVLKLHLKLSGRKAIAHAEGLLEECRVREPGQVLRQYPHELSGGMRQRVLIAMAFACRPKLIIAAPQHPYTVALLHATPRYDRPAGELRPVPEALTAELLAETRRLDHAGAA